MAVGLARVTGGIGRARDRDEGKAVLAGYVACPRVRTHDATVVPVMHEECRYLDLAEVEARQVFLEAAWLEGNPPNARSSAKAEARWPSQQLMVSTHCCQSGFQCPRKLCTDSGLSGNN